MLTYVLSIEEGTYPMMATHRTPADGEALGPAIRILVKRVMADQAPGASSREETPSASDMSHLIGLTERSLRRAYAELKETGWLDPGRGWPEAPRADTPERRAVLEGRRTDLSADDLPSFSDHIRMLEVIRDRALAKDRENTALSAQHEIGKAMGHDRPRRTTSDRNVRPHPALPRRQPGEGRVGAVTPQRARKLRHHPHPGPPHAAIAARGRERLARPGGIRPRTGRGGHRAGPNWLELARIGSNWLT